MGSLLGGSTKTTQTSNPWAPQGDALKGIFSEAGDLYNNTKGTPFYEGDLYAGMDPTTAQALRAMLAYQSGQGTDTANAVSNYGKQALGSNGFGEAIDRFSASAGVDPTQANIAAATAYANNPAIDGMIDAASRDVNRNLYENQIPTINREATATGNINSSRAGVAQGIAERGAADRVGDISSAIRGQAFDRGLGLAEGARGTNLNAQATAAGLYGDQLSTGLGAMTAGNSMLYDGFGTAIDGSRLFQQDAQGKIDSDFTKWQGNDTRQWDMLNNYYNIVGANNWGGTQTTKQKTSGSILGSLLGAGSMLAGFGAFGGGKKG